MSDVFAEGWEDLLGEACRSESGWRTIVWHHLGGLASAKQKLLELIAYAESSFQKLFFFFFLFMSKNPPSKIAAS